MLAWRGLVFSYDVIALLLGWWTAFMLRFNLDLGGADLDVFLKSLPIVFFTQLAVLMVLRPSQGLWRFVSLPDLRKFILFAILSVLAAVFIVTIVKPNLGVPRAVWLMDPFILITLLVSPRLIRRYFYERNALSTAPVNKNDESQPVKKALLIGAGIAGN
jgi:FlaA1/EpsC-like NDP-sugar epimerase